MKIYLASSWRNGRQPAVLAALREMDQEVYDFRHPREGDDGFRWSDVGLEIPADGKVLPAALREAHRHPRAVEGFGLDYGAMRWADAGILLLPSGLSAHMEAAWMAGCGKSVVALCDPDQPMMPELMYKLVGPICSTVEEAVDRLRTAYEWQTDLQHVGVHSTRRAP